MCFPPTNLQVLLYRVKLYGKIKRMLPRVSIKGNLYKLIIRDYIKIIKKKISRPS